VGTSDGAAKGITEREVLRYGREDGIAVRIEGTPLGLPVRFPVDGGVLCTFKVGLALFTGGMFKGDSDGILFLQSIPNFTTFFALSNRECTTLTSIQNKKNDKLIKV